MMFLTERSHIPPKTVSKLPENHRLKSTLLGGKVASSLVPKGTVKFLKIQACGQVFFPRSLRLNNLTQHPVDCGRRWPRCNVRNKGIEGLRITSGKGMAPLAWRFAGQPKGKPMLKKPCTTHVPVPYKKIGNQGVYSHLIYWPLAFLLPNILGTGSFIRA